MAPSARRFFAFLGLTSLIFALPVTAPANCGSGQNGSLRIHSVMVNGRGRPVDPVTENELTDAEYMDRVEATMDAMGIWVRDQIALGVEKPRVLVYVHGGLKTLRASRTLARKITPQIMNEEDPHHRAFPVFIMYSSGLISSLGEELWHVRRGQWTGPNYETFFIAPAKLVQLLGTGVAQVPSTMARQFKKSQGVFFGNNGETEWAYKNARACYPDMDISWDATSQNSFGSRLGRMLLSGRTHQFER